MSNLIQFNSVYKSYPNESMGVKEALVSIYNREKKNYHETHPTLENITFSVEKGQSFGLVDTMAQGKAHLSH